MNGTEIQERNAKINRLHDLLNRVQDFMEKDSTWDEVLLPLENSILEKLKALNAP